MVPTGTIGSYDGASGMPSDIETVAINGSSRMEDGCAAPPMKQTTRLSVRVQIPNLVSRFSPQLHGSRLIASREIMR